MENEIMFIKLDDIIPNRFQPREVFEEEALGKLADSIRQHGVIEPILVRPVSNKYEIIAGERRYKASVLAGLTKIPAIVKQMDDKESSIIAYIENEHRSNVSAIEEARTIERILKSNNMKQDELAKELGINQSTLANKLRLLSLPEEVQDALMHNEISERHARSLLSVKNRQQQIELLNKIKEKRMTVRELDSEIKSMNNSLNNQNGYINNIMNNNQGVQPSNIPNNGGFIPNMNNYVGQNQQMSSTENQDFANYLNNYDNMEINKQTGVNDNDNFQNYLNNFDNNNSSPIQSPNSNYENYLNNNNLGKTEEQTDPGFMNFLNNYDNTNPLPEQKNDNNSFNDYLNNYDNNSNNQGVSAQADSGFMNFLNNYDNTNPLQEANYNNYEKKNELDNNNSINSQNDVGFMNFLNNFDNNNTPIEQDVNDDVEDLNTSNYNEYLNNYNDNSFQPLNSNSNNDNYNEIRDNNVLINDVNPPITSDFNANSYVENSPNYVDITKNKNIGSVDEVIDRLKVVIDDIKNNGQIKIDTDEINYDDFYQITIKIDKKDF